MTYESSIYVATQPKLAQRTWKLVSQAEVLKHTSHIIGRTNFFFWAQAVKVKLGWYMWFYAKSRDPEVHELRTQPRPLLH